MSLPAVLFVSDLRRFLPGWSADRIREFLHGQAIARVDGRGLTYTTTELLRDVVPDVLRALEAKSSSAPIDPDDFSDLTG